MAIYKLKDVCKIKRGSSPRPINEWLSKDGLHWAKISDINNYEINDTKEFVKCEWTSKGVVGKYGDLFLTNSATPGIPFIQKIKNDVGYHDGFLKIDPNEELVNKEYLKLKFIAERPKIVNLGNGSIFVNLKKEIIENLEFDFPTIQKQKQIIDIIEPFEIEIEKLRSTNEKILAIAKSQKITGEKLMISHCDYIRGKTISNDENGKTLFLNVAAANGNPNKYCNEKPNTFVGDVTLSLDGNTGLVNKSLSGFNGYLYKVVSSEVPNWKIYFSLLRKENQDIIKQNETGTTIKHSPNSKKQLKLFEFENDELLKNIFEMSVVIELLLPKLIKQKENLIKLLIK